MPVKEEDGGGRSISGYLTRSQHKTTNGPDKQSQKKRQTGGADLTSKCNCYGNPQVCNVCLVKKEIHASRAGTPGYRPPEVLLKYPDQTTAVDIWAVGVIFLSILSTVYPFFKAPNDYVALAEMVTIFGDKVIRKTAFILDRLVTLSQRTKPLDLRRLCVRFRNRGRYSSTELVKIYQKSDGTCDVCENCDQYYFNCLCKDSKYSFIPMSVDDDIFPDSAYDLLNKLLEINPHKRITAEEALKHPFFTEFNSNHKMNNNNVRDDTRDEKEKYDDSKNSDDTTTDSGANTIQNDTQSNLHGIVNKNNYKTTTTTTTTTSVKAYNGADEQVVLISSDDEKNTAKKPDVTPINSNKRK